MREAAVILFVFVLWGLWAPAPTRPASYLPPPPSSRPPSRPDAAEEHKAFDLYRLARKANRHLAWDRCLALKAYIRAKDLVNRGYFDHADPVTGGHPAWDLIRRCYPYRWAGENLVKGMDDPEHLHRALMNSPSHRKNIMDPHFNRIGIACYDFICVQLFAGS